MSDGMLFHAIVPATQNARLPRRRLVAGTARSLRAARVETDIILKRLDPSDTNVLEMKHN